MAHSDYKQQLVSGEAATHIHAGITGTTGTMAKKIHLVIIDPQNDFCEPNGALYVAGAADDSKRLATFIDRVGHKLDDVHVTLDSHHEIDVAHPSFWLDTQGNHPNPFTVITHDDVVNGKWTPVNPAWRKRMEDYTKRLSDNNRYALVVWPYHCLIGSQGAAVVPPVFDSLKKWAMNERAIIDFVTKGSNVFTEHYSAVQADVPDPADPSTMLNTGLIQTLEAADEVLLTGQALSHCLANTCLDIAANFGDENIKKLVLLEDTSSNVPGFEHLGDQFVLDMKARGMRTAKSTEYA